MSPSQTADSARPYRRILLILVLASFLFSVYTIFFRTDSPRMSFLNWGADHISHQYATIVFGYRGLAIYLQPVEELLSRADSTAAREYAEENKLPPDEIFVLPERHQPARPVFLNWPKLARVYPPGLYLYTLPEALALEWTDWPAPVINGFSLVKFALVIHLALWVLFSSLLEVFQDEKSAKILPVALWIGLFVVIQTQVCFWTLSGFYDGIAVLFVILFLVRYRQRRWAEAIFFFALAVFFHYRSLWYVPVAALAVCQLGRGDWTQAFRPVRQALWLAGALLLLAVSGFFFVLAYPSLTQFPDNNPLAVRRWGSAGIPWLLVAATVAGAAFLIYRREWTLLAAGVGIILFLLNTRQVQGWHSLFLIPLLLCPRRITAPWLVVATMIYAALSWAFFEVMPFDPLWARVYYLGG